MNKRALIALLAISLAGSAVAGSIFKTGITEEDFQKKVDAGPVLKPLVKTTFDVRPAGTKIEVYYKRFSILHLANTHLRVLDLAIRKRHEARVRPPWRNRI